MFVSIKRNLNDGNSLLLCSNVQPLIGGPNMQVLCISKRRKTETWGQVIDLVTKVRKYLSLLVYLNGNNAAEWENNIKYASSYPMNWTVKNWFVQDFKGHGHDTDEWRD